MDKLRNKMKEKNVSQTKLANVLNMSQPNFSKKMSSGGFKLPEMRKIAQVLETSICNVFHIAD